MVSSTRIVVKDEQKALLRPSNNSHFAFAGEKEILIFSYIKEVLQAFLWVKIRGLKASVTVYDQTGFIVIEAN